MAQQPVGPSTGVTIRDVAARAGVSVATVSRVITGAANVQGSRRTRVESAMSDLGYHPSSLAANLRNQRLQMFAAVVPRADDPLIAETLQAIQQATFEAGFELLLSSTGDVATTEATILRNLARQRVAGVVIAASEANAPEIGSLLDLGIAVVALDQAVRDPRADAVLVDDFEGVRRAAQHLIAAGHRKIAFVGGSLDVESDAQRLAGYEAAMRAAGLPPITSTESSRIGGGWLGTAKVLERQPDATAIITGNSRVALGALDLLRQRRMSIPHDMSVLCIDDPFWCGLIDPKLSALAAPIQMLGQSAVRLLLRRIAEPAAPSTRVVLELELRARASIATLTAS